MLARKKPIVIECFRFGLDVNPQWFSESLNQGKSRIHPDLRTVEIDTLEGTHLAYVGDVIIQGVKGELYPCKPDIFDMTYEIVG